MKKKRSPKRRRLLRKKKRPAGKLTLEQVVQAAHEAGAKVTVSLVPQEPERPRLKLSTKEWPGTPYIRSIMADLDYTEKDVAQVFKDNPSSLWVITPYEVFERTKFFAPKPAPAPEGEQQTNPS
jgi:signal recognition particle subunit SEC65